MLYPVRLTPSLFYQFLGAYERFGMDAPKHVAFDSYSFCTALGKEEANKQLRRHWQTWVTEDIIREIAESGVDTIRIPVGDWMFIPYEPYIGCFDGAIDELDRILILLEKYSLKAFIEIHAMKYQQNSYDNCGKVEIKWNTPTQYEHVLSATWIGIYDPITKLTKLTLEGPKHAYEVINVIIDKYKNNPTIVGLEPLNEPWDHTPIEALKEFYWNTYQLVQLKVPKWITIFSDSMRMNLYLWNNFLKECNNFAFDAHPYFAWSNPQTILEYQINGCNRYYFINEIEKAGIPLIIGEWSLATDNCALWLQGLNNNVPGFPKKQCDMVKCVDPYMGPEQPGAPPDKYKGQQDPYGEGMT